MGKATDIEKDETIFHFAEHDWLCTKSRRISSISFKLWLYKRVAKSKQTCIVLVYYNNSQKIKYQKYEIKYQI